MMLIYKFKKLLGIFALAIAALSPTYAHADNFEAAFDQALGTNLRAPISFRPAYSSTLEQRIGLLADGDKGRIGVAAIDLATGEQISILGQQHFPMASTSKIAIAATFLDGVDRGRWSLDQKFPLMIPVRSPKYSSAVAPVKRGKMLPARELIELMITRSNNSATDAILAAIGGPSAVNRWTRRAGIQDFQINRDIATLVRDDGEVDPAAYIDKRDSATPLAMATLLKGLHQGQWLSAASRNILIGAMERCRTGKRRIPALMPANALVAHKTGSLNNTSSDIGIITAPNGRSIAIAIYVTGQGTRRKREARIATIARAIYDGYAEPTAVWANARYAPKNGS